MKREICIKCNKCFSMMSFNSFSNSFVCPKCQDILKLDKINNKTNFKIIDDIDNNFENKKVLPINFSKEDFISKLKIAFKYKKLAPNCFFKFNKYKDSDIKLIYIPLILYESECIVYFDNQKEKNSLYKISNMVFDEYTSFDKETLNSLYPIDLYSNVEELSAKSEIIIEKFNMKFDDILNSIQSKAKDILIDTIKLDLDAKENFDVIFLKQNFQCILLPIYDCNIRYNKNDYHLSMNASTGKISIKVPVDNTKLFIILVLFLAIDIIFFYLSHLARMIEEYCIGISIGLFITQILMILFLYLFTKDSRNDKYKNKYYISKIKKSNK